MTCERGTVLWRPPTDIRERSQIGEFLRWLHRERDLQFKTYDELHRWSVEDLEGFWSAVWEYFEIQASGPYRRVLEGSTMPDNRWFPGALLNYAEHALRLKGSGCAVVGVSQSRGRIELTRDELRDQVSRVRCALRRHGVAAGDRVVAYAPNIPETLIAYLAVASLGAVWSSCSPEFGTRAVVDRFRQIEPTVLLAVNGYRYGDKTIDRTAELADIRAGLPSIQATVVIAYVPTIGVPTDVLTWSDLLDDPGDGMEFERVPFDHPMVILFSSGTTGLPKPIVHGHGGLLLEHFKSLGFHLDVREGDQFFWYSTTSWVMWNILVSGLLLGASVVLFDGDPLHPGPETLWHLAADPGLDFFGVSPGFLAASMRAPQNPTDDVDLRRLRGIGSTGAPLPVAAYEWIYEHVKSDVMLTSTSGGTEIGSGFFGGSPLLPVFAGEMSAPCLGCDVAAVDSTGAELIGEEGELVVRRPMPSMPVGLWGDRDGRRLQKLYYDDFPGVWRHGDWVTLTARGTAVISGRSDATLNRGGVRLGTADIYAVVEELPEISDSLVVYADADLKRSDELLLFVVLVPGISLNEELRQHIARAIRTQLSPRHVPDAIFAVTAIPRTLSGKRLEVPVKRIISGANPDDVAARGALANPEALAEFVAFAADRFAQEQALDAGH